MTTGKSPPKTPGKFNTPVTIDGKIINLSEIHRQTGVSITHLSKIFCGRKRPGFQVLIKIAATTGMSADDLIGALAERQEQWNRTKRLNQLP